MTTDTELRDAIRMLANVLRNRGEEIDKTPLRRDAPPYISAAQELYEIANTEEPK